MRLQQCVRFARYARSLSTSTECKTLKGERRMIFIFNIITALNYNQDGGIFCPCGKDALSLPVLIIKYYNIHFFTSILAYFIGVTMLHFMYWRLRIRMWCTLFHFDSCPEKKLVNNCLDIDHSCSHLLAVNPAIFHGVTFNNFVSGLIYGSKKKRSTKCHFQTSCAILCTMSV